MRRQWPRAPGRPQSHIDLIEHAVIGLYRERADQPLRQARKILGAVKRTFAVGIRMLGVEIVNDDEIEIGARGHFAGAEAAECQDRGLLAAHAPMRRGEIGFDAGVQRADQHVGEAGEHLAGLFGGQRAGEDARADQEHVLLAEPADGIEHVLVAARFAESAREVRFEALCLRQRAEEAGVDQRIDDMRVLRQDVGEPRRDAEDQRDEANKLRVLPQQREQAPAGAQAGKKPVEGGERRIRIFRARELVDNNRDKLGEILARLLAAQRRVTGRVPAAYCGGTLARLPETNFRQTIERLARVVALAFRERQVLALGEQGRRAFE